MDDSLSLFTSESVSAGHPDKIADQISDAILDSAIRSTIAMGDKSKHGVEHVRVACETLVKTGMVLVAGEMRCEGWVDVEQLVREHIKEIGYIRPHYGFNYEDCAVLNAIGEQSEDIAEGVDADGAGDQGTMFGYACDETDALMPMPIDMAHRLIRRHDEVRRKELPWLGPDAKAQVTVVYDNGRPQHISRIVLSSQHLEDFDDGQQIGKHDPRLRSEIIEHIIRQTAGEHLAPDWSWEREAGYCHINPTGIFVKGGPQADCGLTGRKIIVDTYGGVARHGGGAFSGKDPTKVDRSAAYAARYIARNIVASGRASRCEVQISYAIGVAEPVAVHINSFGTGKAPDAQLQAEVRERMKLRPAAIIERLDLWQPIYLQTAVGGHFGRPQFSWEQGGLFA